MEKLTKRILAAIMTAMLLITMLPVSAIEQELGDETEGTAAAEQVTETQGDTVEEPEETEEAEDTEENTVDAEIH